MPVILTLINLTILPSFEFVYFFHKYFFATFILYKRSLSVSIMKSVSEIHDLVVIIFSYGSRIMYDKRSNLWFVGNTPCLLRAWILELSALVYVCHGHCNMPDSTHSLHVLSRLINPTRRCIDSLIHQHYKKFASFFPNKIRSHQARVTLFFQTEEASVNWHIRVHFSTY